MGDDGHETLLIEAGYTEDPKRKAMGIHAFNFCKTARKPYDSVVKAILISAYKHGVIDKPFTFDGNRSESEYKDGMALYKKATAK